MPHKNHGFQSYTISSGLSSPGAGVLWHLQILQDQLTRSQPEGVRYCTNLFSQSQSLSDLLDFTTWKNSSSTRAQTVLRVSTCSHLTLLLRTISREKCAHKNCYLNENGSNDTVEQLTVDISLCAHFFS